MYFATLLIIVCLCYLEGTQGFVFRPSVFSSKVVSPKPVSKSVALNYVSIKVEREPEDDDSDVVDRYFSLLAESDVLDIAMSKQRMLTKNDEKKRRKINARVKTLKYADEEDEEDDDEIVEHGDTKLPEYQDLGL
mmetsp:Transcript_7660/g.8360  ORF Transcript_7660/g.8360 Transcript_7660/m.8360 type:complete len:135 (+) Transcript_7660:70-474(+)